MAPSPTPPAASGPAVSPPALLGRRERMVLAAVAAVLALLLVWLRGGLHPEASLERLARRSPELTTALADGRPTMVEFYADWCTACRAMAPAMESLEQRHQGALDVVLLNVDNPRWQEEVERYGVNGIPHLELFDREGRSVGRSLGARRPEELAALSDALLNGTPLPSLAGVGAISDLPDAAGTTTDASSSGAPVGPRSHG
ncbi:MAG: thioredoxin domain-containing protein [Cyanobium sp.]